MTNQQKTYIFGVAGIIIIAALVWWGVNKQQQNQVTGEPIRIGAIFMLSGAGSSWGQNSQRGADLAVEEINANEVINGQPLEIAYEDNQGDNPKVAVSAMQKFIGRGINIILGPTFTPSGLAVAPIACQNEVLMISPTLGVKEFNESCDYLFNVWQHDFVLSERLGHYLYEKGIRKVVVLGSQQAWELEQAQAVKRGFEQAGGQVVAFELPQKDQRDFRAEAAKIKNANAEAVVFTALTYEDVAAKQLREVGVTVPFYSILLDDEHIQGAQGALEGTVVITSFNPTDAFIQKFEKRYSTKIDIGADTSYDAVMLIAEAMKKTGSTDPSVLKGYLGSLKDYEGASGKLKFDGKRGVLKEPSYKIVRDSKLVPYEPTN